jgi:hypothetical protein
MAEERRGRPWLAWGLATAVLGACTGPAAAPPPVPAPTTVTVSYSMNYALAELSGLHLGMKPDEVEAMIQGPCAPRSYFGGTRTGGVTELVCSMRGERGGTVWVGFSKPAAGQNAWRIFFKRRGQGEQKPLEMWWRRDRTNLRVIGEPDGLRFELWDRGLNH